MGAKQTAAALFLTSFSSLQRRRDGSDEILLARYPVRELQQGIFLIGDGVESISLFQTRGREWVDRGKGGRPPVNGKLLPLYIVILGPAPALAARDVRSRG